MSKAPPTICAVLQIVSQNSYWFVMKILEFVLVRIPEEGIPNYMKNKHGLTQLSFEFIITEKKIFLVWLVYWFIGHHKFQITKAIWGDSSMFFNDFLCKKFIFQSDMLLSNLRSESSPSQIPKFSPQVSTNFGPSYIEFATQHK